MMAFDPRVVQRTKFASTLQTYDKFKALSSDAQDTIIRRIERSCHTKTIDECDKNFIPKVWSEPKFTQRYSTECYRILSNLELSSTTLDLIIDNKIDLNDIAKIDSASLNPDGSRFEREEIKIRSEQKVEKKCTTRYKCGKCGTSKAEINKNQRSAGDELETITFVCLNCNNSWQ
jgi:DNA-directed RNA polymerase subunit M/transcription elongation factor TFIIS